MKKIAIFHNFLDNIGGAEIVDLILARELGADIYTTNVDKEKIQKMGFGVDNVYSIGSVPINAPFKQELAYWKFRALNLGSKYDFYIIAGDWAMSGGVHHHPNLWYVHSPTREIWDLASYIRKHAVPGWQRPIFDIWVRSRRLANRRDIKNIDKIASVSRNVQFRVQTYFNKDSVVVYPPVEIKRYRYQKNGNFWLAVNRFFIHKRVDIQMKAFAKMPAENLIVVGSYEKSSHFQQYANYIKKIKPKNVEIRSWICQSDLINLYANCKGFITTSKDEDFGLTPLEAMASGKPVIAPNEGGYRETIISGVTGKLINDIDIHKLIIAVKEVGANPQKYREACLAQAKKFDVNIFVKKIKKILKDA